MKRLFLMTLFVLTTLVTYGQFVTGYLAYPANGFNYFPGQLTTLKFNKTVIYVNVDSINDQTCRDLLKLSGVPDSNIIEAIGRGSTVDDIIELWFAYKGSMPSYRGVLSNINARHSWGGDVKNDWITGTIFKKLDTARIIAATKYLIDSFRVYSFFIPYHTDSIWIEKILNKNPANGAGANMRWTPRSVQYVQRFKALNWVNIQYNEAEVKNTWKNIFRPRQGW